jgi:hypothetical protein
VSFLLLLLFMLRLIGIRSLFSECKKRFKLTRSYCTSEHPIQSWTPTDLNTISNRLRSQPRYESAILKLHLITFRLSIKSPRKAAVLIPLCFSTSRPSILFTLRSSNVSTHKVPLPSGFLQLLKMEREK